EGCSAGCSARSHNREVAGSSPAGPMALRLPYRRWISHIRPAPARPSDSSRATTVTRARRLGLVLAVNLAMVVSLLLVGLLAHSLGVLAAGADYLGDALGAGLSLLALRRARRDDRSRASS